MRMNRFSSASDSWQRRYERIQERKEYEQYRRELDEQAEFDQLLKGIQMHRPQYIHDMDAHPLVNPTVTITAPRFDEPNRNGTVISRDTWTSAMEEYVKTASDTSQNSIVDSILRIANGEADESDKSDVVAYIREQMERRVDGKSRYELIREAFQRYIDERWFGSFADVKDIPFGDRATIGIDLANAEMIEPDLDAGDNSALDSFLDEFFSLRA